MYCGFLQSHCHIGMHLPSEPQKQIHIGLWGNDPANQKYVSAFPFNLKVSYVKRAYASGTIKSVQDVANPQQKVSSNSYVRAIYTTRCALSLQFVRTATHSIADQAAYLLTGDFMDNYHTTENINHATCPLPLAPAQAMRNSKGLSLGPTFPQASIDVSKLDLDVFKRTPPRKARHNP